MHRKHSQDFKFCLDGVSKQQHPHVVLKDREPLLLVVRVHDAYHPGGVEAGLREAAGEGPPGEALPVELLPLPGDQPPHVLLRVTSRILHQVQLPVRPVQSFLCFVLGAAHVVPESEDSGGTGDGRRDVVGKLCGIASSCCVMMP